MVNLALYSDQIIPENSAIDTRLVSLMQGRGRRVGYIPSGPDPGMRFFNDRKRYYERIGLDLSMYYDLDEDHGAEATEALLACDAIHLSGGHTGSFLARLRKTGMLSRLRAWAISGGVLIGTSAGAILVTPTIAVDALFSGERPEDVRDGEALNLLPFEFFPHLNAEPNYITDLLRYSRQIPRAVIACNDGDGVVVAGGMVELVGNPLWIKDGDAKEARQMGPGLFNQEFGRGG